MFQLISSYQSRQVQFPLIVSEEIATLSNRLVSQWPSKSIRVLAILSNSWTEEEKRWKLKNLDTHLLVLFESLLHSSEQEHHTFEHTVCIKRMFWHNTMVCFHCESLLKWWLTNRWSITNSWGVCLLWGLPGSCSRYVHAAYSCCSIWLHNQEQTTSWCIQIYPLKPEQDLQSRIWCDLIGHFLQIRRRRYSGNPIRARYTLHRYLGHIIIFDYPRSRGTQTRM